MRRRILHLVGSELTENPRQPYRFVTWLGDVTGRHGTWVYTWDGERIEPDVMMHAYQRGYAAGYAGNISENPADFKQDGSSPDLELVNVWFEGYNSGERAARDDRRKPTLRMQRR